MGRARWAGWRGGCAGGGRAGRRHADSFLSAALDRHFIKHEAWYFARSHATKERPLVGERGVVLDRRMGSKSKLPVADSCDI